MRYLLSLTLVALAALLAAGCASRPVTEVYTVAQTSGGANCQRIAQPGDTKIQIYCKKPMFRPLWPIAAQPVADTTCRWIADPTGKKTQKVCDNAAHWDQFDMLAVNTGVTCRWYPGPRHARNKVPEICLNAPEWKVVESSLVGVPFGGGSNWGGGNTGGSQAAYATSFGPFPAGGAIGQ
jgi:hypothetical protein